MGSQYLVLNMGIYPQANAWACKTVLNPKPQIKQTNKQAKYINCEANTLCIEQMELCASLANWAY